MKANQQEIKLLYKFTNLVSNCHSFPTLLKKLLSWFLSQRSSSTLPDGKKIICKLKNPARHQPKSLPNAQNKNTYASQLMPVIFFPKLLYIMLHYRAIKKKVLQNKIVHCPIITLCKKAAHPTLKCPAPATHFWQLSSHHHSYQKHVASRVTLRVIHKNVFP